MPACRICLSSLSILDARTRREYNVDDDDDDDANTTHGQRGYSRILNNFDSSYSILCWFFIFCIIFCASFSLFARRSNLLRLGLPINWGIHPVLLVSCVSPSNPIFISVPKETISQPPPCLVLSCLALPWPLYSCLLFCWCSCVEQLIGKLSSAARLHHPFDGTLYTITAVAGVDVPKKVSPERKVEKGSSAD